MFSGILYILIAQSTQIMFEILLSVSLTAYCDPGSEQGHIQRVTQFSDSSRRNS